MIRWLHISDLHLGDEDVSSSSMRDDLLTFLSEQDKPFDYIFLTGDIRSAGPRYAGYTPEMADYIKRICDVCHIPVEQLFIVPGNHDIDRDADGRDEAIRRVMFQRNGYYDPYFGIINPEDLECIRDGQKSFRDFLSKIYSDDRLACYSNPQAPHFVVETEDFNILHLDSTISYTKDQEAVDLIVGMEKLCQTLKGLNDRKPTIVLTHYPFTSLLQDERKNLAIRLQKKGIRLWLAGHEHDHNLLHHQYLHILQSGELRYEKDSCASVLIGEHDPDSYRCEVKAYKWYPEGWAEYPFVNLDSEDKSVYRFQLKPADSNALPSLTRKTRQANRHAVDRLTKKLDRTLFPPILSDTGTVSLGRLIGDAWATDHGNIILLGDGGMGKTTMLLDFCRESTTPVLYVAAEQLASLGIGLEEYCISSLFDGNDSDFRKALTRRFNVPSLIIIVDGLNEIDADSESMFIKGIQRLGLLKGIQILIASRVDFTTRYNLQGYAKAGLGRLDDKTLEAYFSPSEWRDIIGSPGLHRLLGNPMLVTVYKEICSVIDEYRDVEFLDWKLPVESSTDLFHNYYLAQIALMMRRNGADGTKILQSAVCVHQILPAIAYRYEVAFSINKLNREYRDILADILAVEAIDDEYPEAIRDHYRLRGKISLTDDLVTDLLINELHLLHRDNGMTSFSHQMYRDYLSARHIMNKTRRDEEINALWNSRRFPLPISAHVMHGCGNYWNGIAPKVKGVATAVEDSDFITHNIFDCFPSSARGGTADYSDLNLSDIRLPDITDINEKISLTGATISKTTLGFGPGQSRPCHALRFSADRSLLAAAFGTNIHIYELKTNRRVFAYDIRKKATAMLFYGPYLIVCSGTLTVFLNDNGWRYAGEIKTESGRVFNSNFRAIVADDDELHIYYKTRCLKYNLRDCSLTDRTDRRFAAEDVIAGTDLKELASQVNIRQFADPKNGTVIIAEADTLKAVAFNDGRIEISSDGEPVSVLGHKNTVLKDAALSNDGSMAVTLSFETFDSKRRIQIWNIDRNTKTRELFCDSSILRVNLSENGRWILGISTDRTWVYNIETGDDRWIDELFVSNQYDKLTTFGDCVMRRTLDGRLQTYSLSTAETADCASPIRNPGIVCLLKDGSVAAADTMRGCLKFRSTRNGELFTIYPDNYKSVIAIHEFSKHPFIAAVDSSGLTSVYHSGTGQRLRKLQNNFKVNLTTRHVDKTIMAHTDDKNRISIDFYKEIDVHGRPRGWWNQSCSRERIDSRILDIAFNVHDQSLIAILSSGRIMYFTEDRCHLKRESYIIVAFNTDAYDFSNVRCSREVADILVQNGCFRTLT